VTGTIGALDRAVSRVPDQRLTAGLCCATWLAQQCRLSSGQAHAQVRLARQLPSLPGTRRAFEQGEISGQHASAVARSVEMVERGGGDPAEAEGLLVEEARVQDARSLLRWGLGLVHRLAPREFEEEEDRRLERRFLRLAELWDGGGTLEGYLDPERWARLKTAIDATLGPRRKDDRRTPGQRRLDALDEVVTQVLDAGRLPARGGQRPHLGISATLDTLCGNPGAPAALLDWGGFPLSGRRLRQIAEDAVITPILVGPKGDPLHVGRRYRTATPKMRRALAQRDRGCVWPGCDRPPAWSQSDHEVPWAKGGETAVEGLRLLCVPHHGKLSRGWRLARGSAGRWVVHPPEPAVAIFGPAIHDPPPG
jgi:hypothetical protein